jgi:hypothetical protein
VDLGCVSLDAKKCCRRWSTWTLTAVGVSPYERVGASPFGQKLSALVHLNSKNCDYRFSALVRLNTVSALVSLNRSALVPLNMSAIVPLNMSALVQHPAVSPF